MPLLDVSPYKPVAGALADANQLANGFQAVQNVVNALDQANFAAGQIFDLSKLQTGGGSEGQYARLTSGVWVPSAILAADLPSNIPVSKLSHGVDGEVLQTAGGATVWGAAPGGGGGGGGTVVPAGAIMHMHRASAPAGWLLCDGSAVSRTTYAALFSVIGTTYGAGDGSSTFNLPNLKGRALVGVDSGQTEFAALGQTGGEKTHLLATSELPAHTHGVGTYSAASHSHNSGTLSVGAGQGNHGHGGSFDDPTGGDLVTHNGSRGAYTAGSSGGYSGGLAANTLPAMNVNGGFTGSAAPGLSGTSGSTGGATTHNNLQPYMALNVFIATG